MKSINLLSRIWLLAGFLLLASCGPVIFSSRVQTTPPGWFYPNRVEVVRYVYFPDYLIYYDLSLRQYIYFENGVWITVNVLPPRFREVNLRRSRFIHINDYYGDRIDTYHRDNLNRGRSNQDVKRGRGN
ncbi:hypothetical protein J1N09_14765 [Aureitalea sp. L0-47]|uniref:hypothetical protein n=1 Tax=Aureitalea sp. L0-47 TaxID=2816962 RepID=UPI00223739C6|nr:hypothetical protein [Aureitalea sp. L0-47]MCW5521108.1 hypothetical protein [Aureitalea sp. L0-47]